jgi:YgiT-type zinc finger domain-containing protein
MVAKAEKCPVCGKGTLNPATIHEEMFGVELGNYPGERCSNCGETFLASDSMDAVEARAKELGLWGLASKVKVARSGNSLVVRIPAPLAQYLKLKKGQEVMVSPERENRLVLELA